MKRAIAALALSGASFIGALTVPASASTPSAVVIHVQRAATDSWTATGAFADSGLFVEAAGVPAFFAGRSSTFHVFRTFTGGNGTFVTRADVRITPTDDPDVLAVTGRWAVLSGTAGYQDLRGAGAIHESVDLTTGVIEGNWTGAVLGV